MLEIGQTVVETATTELTTTVEWAGQSETDSAQRVAVTTCVEKSVDVDTAG